MEDKGVTNLGNDFDEENIDDNEEDFKDFLKLKNDYKFRDEIEKLSFKLKIHCENKFSDIFDNVNLGKFIDFFVDDLEYNLSE